MVREAMNGATEGLGRLAVIGQGTRRLLIGTIDAVASVALIAMMVHVVANGILRSFAGSPIEHTLEYVQYWYLPVIAMLGFLSAQLRGRHITADLLYQALPKSVKRWVTVGSNLLCAVVMCAFARGTWHDALHRLEIRQTAGLTDVPTWPVHFVLPLTFALLGIGFAAAAYRGVRRVDLNDLPGEADEVMALLVAEGAMREDQHGRSVS